MSDTAITKQILLTRRSPAYWRVTFNHPPLNIFGPDAILQLNEIITEEAPSLDAGGAALPGAAMGLHRAIPPVNPANPKTTGTPGLFPLRLPVRWCLAPPRGAFATRQLCSSMPSRAAWLRTHVSAMRADSFMTSPS